MSAQIVALPPPVSSDSETDIEPPRKQPCLRPVAAAGAELPDPVDSDSSAEEVEVETRPALGANADRLRVMHQVVLHILHIPEARHRQKHHLLELFSRPRLVPEAQKAGLTALHSIDLVTGYNLTLLEDKRRVLQLLADHEPEVSTTRSQTVKHLQIPVLLGRLFGNITMKVNKLNVLGKH